MKTSPTRFAFAPRAALAAVSLFAALTTACSGPADDASTSGEDLAADLASDGAAVTPIGHYVLAGNGEPSDAAWINEINLHENGTFDANLGTGQSSVSGHFYLANGTYSVAQTSAGSALSLTYAFGASTLTDRYAVRAAGAALQFKSQTDDSPEDPWFTMDKASAPISVSFAADGSVAESAALVAGGTALVRYAASRDKCTGANEWTGLFTSVDGAAAQSVAFPAAVDGVLEVMVPIPSGRELTVWFENSNGPGCTHWDSNDGRNYSFRLAPAAP